MGLDGDPAEGSLVDLVGAGRLMGLDGGIGEGEVAITGAFVGPVVELGDLEGASGQTAL